MLYILLAAFCSLLIIIVFKRFDDYQINHNQAIVVNYNVCTITGCLILGEIPLEFSMIYAPWMPIMLFLGVLFVGGFNVASRTVRHFGVAVSSVAQRMSMGISVSFAIWYYNESYSLYKIVGIIVAILAVVFINIPNKKDTTDNKKDSPKWLIIFPISICLISAIIEIVMQYLNNIYEMLPSQQSILMFGTAAFIGIVVLLVRWWWFGEKLELRSLTAGIILGIPNYFSLYFILCAFETMEGSMVYSLNNIIIVVSAALVGLFVFKERLSMVNLIGIGLAVGAIFLITL